LSEQDNTAQQRRALYKIRAGQYSRLEQRTGKGRTIQHIRRQHRLGQDNTVQQKAGQIRAGQVRAGQYSRQRTALVRAGQYSTAEESALQV
jgi:hypothetical protein